MKFTLSIFCFLISFVSFSQNDFSEGDARDVIDTFFEGFHKGDTIKMRSVMLSSIIMQTVYTDKDGKSHIKDDSADNLINAIAKRPEKDKWDERLLDYIVQIDGNLAHVWTPYEFWFNDVFSHCGANAFTLAKTDDGWKITHLIDSRRKKKCN